MPATLEFDSLTEDQKTLVERLASNDGPTMLMLHGEPMLNVTPVYEFEPLSKEEEDELIAIADQADADLAAGRLTPYKEIRLEWGLAEKTTLE